MLYDMGIEVLEPPPDVGSGGVDSRELCARFRALVERRRALDAEIALVVDEARRTGAYLDDAHRSVNAWCRANARWSDVEASTARRLGRFLADHPDAASAALSGTLGTTHLDRLARAYANPRCGHRLAEFLPILLPHAANLSSRDFDQVMDRWTAHADPDGSSRSHRAANEGRFCSIKRSGAGYSLQGQFGVLQGAQLQRILQIYTDVEFKIDWAAAEELHGADTCLAHLARTPAQRSADALVRLALDGVLASSTGEQPTFVVNIVAAQTVLDAVQARATGDRWAMPEGDPRTWRCETDDGVPIDPSDLLTAAIIGHIRRIVVDSASVVVDVGRRRRTFTGPMREAVLLMATHCDFAGCNIPAARCQVDHDHPWRDDGHTRTRDARIRCGHHNRARNAGWTIVPDHAGYWRTRRPDGSPII